MAVKRPPNNPRMIRIRSGSGLGDALYLQSIARHLLTVGKEVEVCSKYEDVFRPLADRITVSPFRRSNLSLVAHYIGRKKYPTTDQFTDCCISAGFGQAVELKLDWPKPIPSRLLDDLDGRPFVVVQLPRAPMGRDDGYGDDLLPDCHTIQRLIDNVKVHANIVQVGKGVPWYRFRGIDLDLANETTVGEMIDVVSVSRGVIGYCSFIVPLAESLRKPTLLVWSRRGLNSKTEFIRLITPQKVLHRPQDAIVVMDDALPIELTEMADAFCQQIGCSPAVRRQARGDRWLGTGCAAK